MAYLAGAVERAMKVQEVTGPPALFSRMSATVGNSRMNTGDEVAFSEQNSLKKP